MVHDQKIGGEFSLSHKLGQFNSLNQTNDNILFTTTLYIFKKSFKLQSPEYVSYSMRS